MRGRSDGPRLLRPAPHPALSPRSAGRGDTRGRLNAAPKRRALRRRGHVVAAAASALTARARRPASTTKRGPTSPRRASSSPIAATTGATKSWPSWRMSPPAAAASPTCRRGFEAFAANASGGASSLLPAKRGEGQDEGPVGRAAASPTRPSPRPLPAKAYGIHPSRRPRVYPPGPSPRLSPQERGEEKTRRLGAPLPARGERQGEGPGDWPQASPHV